MILKKSNSLLAASGVEHILECQVEVLPPHCPQFQEYSGEIFVMLTWAIMLRLRMKGERMFLAWGNKVSQAARCA